MATVQVKYKYGSPRPSTSSMATMTVQGTTESAVMVELQRLYPSHKNIVIISIEIRRA